LSTFEVDQKKFIKVVLRQERILFKTHV